MPLTPRLEPFDYEKVHESSSNFVKHFNKTINELNSLVEKWDTTITALETKIADLSDAKDSPATTRPNQPSSHRRETDQILPKASER
ncbi:hypothetical protein COTS27_01042 [Spirochaetota bacterium]|nr:hypothetical protein COTS27_01042 [Spirochaetota bacterium]